MTPSGIISPLSLNPLTRDLWGNFDVAIMAQLADLSIEHCYQMKFYKAPNSEQELFPANGYVPYGLRITPGSIIFGFYLSVVSDTGSTLTNAFTVQITDVSLQHEWFDAPLSSLFLGNYKPTQQSNGFDGPGSFPNLLTSPYPVVGTGLFMVEIQETSGAQQRIELIFGVLEVCQSQ